MTLQVQYETLVGKREPPLRRPETAALTGARFVDQSEILLLDDCTSALDAATEHRIQETLAKIMVSKTAVIVSSGFHGVALPQVAIVNQGVIAEFGTHHELLAKGGYYARLHASRPVIADGLNIGLDVHRDPGRVYGWIYRRGIAAGSRPVSLKETA